MGIGSNIGKALLAQAPDMAPGAAVSMLRSILGFAIDGASSLPGARQAAGKTLTKHDGDVEQAINSGAATFKLEDDKGHVYLIRTERVLYVEQGSAAARSVGFMR